MKRATGALLACAALLAVASPAPGHAQQSEIRQIFEAYREALLNKNGDAATRLVTSGTVRYYDEMRKHALCSPRDSILALRLIDQFQVLILRLRLPADSLETLSPEEIIAIGVDRGWIGEEATRQLQLGEVTVDGDQATATVKLGGEESPVPFFGFVREDGDWRLNLLFTLGPSGDAFEEAMRQSGMEHDEYIYFILSTVAEFEVGSEIWEPPAHRPDLWDVLSYGV